MTPIKVGLLGLGTVGSAVVNALHRNKDEITRRAGREIIVTHAVVRDPNKSRACDTSSIVLLTDPKQLIENDEVDIIVELMGGEHEAFKTLMEMLERGKPVVTANKALIALHGNELFAKAEEKNTVITFEAAVGAGIPIIKSLRESLAGNHIQWVAGIINGTSNYILSEMSLCEAEFSECLDDAKRQGYAEADPTLDIGGFDAAHKLTIVASIAFGIPLQYDKVYIEGIDSITLKDIQYAKELGYEIKHLGIAKRSAEGIELRVHPTLIPTNCLLANVNGVNNAVLINGDLMGPSVHYGAGAGGDATASGVVGDIIDLSRVITIDPSSRVPHLAFQKESLHFYPLLTEKSVETACYLRLHGVDRPGLLAEITRVLAEKGISIKAILQKGVVEEKDLMPIVIETHPVLEQNMNEAISLINSIDGVHDEVTRIRIDLLDSLENSL